MDGAPVHLWRHGENVGVLRCAQNDTGFRLRGREQQQLQVQQISPLRCTASVEMTFFVVGEW
jgi:hypothetical protein